MVQELTDIQERVLEFVRNSMRSTGRSPTMREIQEAFGYKSPHTPKFHIDKLVAAGYLNREPGHRGLQLIEEERSGIRLLGMVAAGPPIEAIEDESERISLNGFEDDHHFALRVRGDSMIEECIADGDHVVVRKQTTCDDGDLVVARISDEATLKRFHHDSANKRVRLQPANSSMEPIFCKPQDLVIEGIVVGVIRLMAK